MKKYFCLLVLLVFGLSGCLMRSPLIRNEEVLARVGSKYAILEPITIAVVGHDQGFINDIKDVFRYFGFSIVNDNYMEKADYSVIPEKEVLGGGYNWGFQVYPVKVRLKILDKNTGIERVFEGTGQYQEFRNSYRYQSYSNNPYGVAAKKAAMEAVGNLIGELGISHRRPKK